MNVPLKKYFFNDQDQEFFINIFLRIFLKNMFQRLSEHST